MDIAAIMDELGQALGTIPDLRVAPYYVMAVNPPQAVVTLPNPYTFDGTYGRGMDTLVYPVVIFAGKVDARSSRDALSKYCGGSGAFSIKEQIEAFEYTTCDSVRVQSVEFVAIDVAGVNYLSAAFQVHTVGSGS